jgi:transcriptional regulator with XRE-family HTH domain
MDIKQRVGNRIKSLRLKRELTQIELSELADLDRTYITSVENGKRNISIVNLEKISHALGLPFLDFFNDEIFEITGKE